MKENDFVVRIKLHDPDEAGAVEKEIKKQCEGIRGVKLRDKNLLIVLEPTGNLDSTLVDLQSCLGGMEKGQGDVIGEIVETGFVGQNEKTVLPGDIYLDPAFSFGSGGHPSTRLAIKLLEKSCESKPPGRVLDVGCGSGILALLAARSGAEYVLGVEIDPESVVTAWKNVEANGLGGKIDISDQSLSKIGGEFDLILANLTASVFFKLEKNIFRLAAEKARLIVSGLQGRQGTEVAERLEKLGWSCRRQGSDGKWRAYLMSKEI